MTPATDEPRALRERKRTLEGIWLLTLVVVLVALAVPWYLRALEIDLAPIAWSVFGFAALLAAAAFASDRLRDRRALGRVAVAMQVAGVLFLGLVWHLAGGLQNPLFVLVFALPVIAAGAVPRRGHALAIALLAVLAVLTVAWIGSPELRRYVLVLGLPAGPLASLAPAAVPAAGEPFPELETPAAYTFSALLLFAALLPTAALAADALGALLRRAEAEGPRRGPPGLLPAALAAAPYPAALVELGSGQVIAASDRFRGQLLLDEADLRRRGFFELVAFDRPDEVAALLEGEGGELPAATLRVGPERRVVRLAAYPVTHGGERYAHVSFHPHPEAAT